MIEELQYPFEAKHILAQKKKLKRLLLSQNINFIEKKIAVLGGSTTNDIILILEIFLLNYGIKASFYESGYNQYYQEAVFDNPKLEKFAPDMIYIHTTNRNISCFPDVKDSAETVNRLLTEEFEKFHIIWQKLHERYHCPIIQNNFELPFYRLMGNKEASDIHGKINFLTRLNMMFYEYVQKNRNVYICDINYISADYGLKEWTDPFYYYMYKYALNINAIPYLAFNVANIIKSLFGKNKKGFVLDLDYTLWGGVVGDDGADHIMLGPEEAEGQAYLEFQKYIREHKQLGIILSVDSKNDFENAAAGLNHPYSELKPEEFAVIKANWNSKDHNFAEIAAETNLLPESLVFIDDNQAERHIVMGQFPEVNAPKIGEVQNYIQNIDRNGFFEVTLLSSDDLKRSKMYHENAKRAQYQTTFSDYGAYLNSLEMTAVIGPFDSVYMDRIAQLTNKSNQFNLTTKRYSLEEVEAASSDGSYITLYGKLEDKFGDNGVVTVVIGRVRHAVCHIELWLMSCRVLKRDMELAMMDRLVSVCRQRGVTELRGYYYPTAKNSMVRDFYTVLGFQKTAEDEEGNTEWRFPIQDDYEAKNHYIRINLI